MSIARKRVMHRWLALAFVVLAAALGCGQPNASNPFARDTPGPTATPTNGRHHPDGFADPAQHGPYAKFLSEDCKTCHGAQLDAVGGAMGAPSCDGCHTAGWRTNCTFCHGGTSEPSGAPPRDITNETDPTKLIFRAHTTHVTASANHVAFDCTQCHAAKPTDILSSGHWIVGDTTPGLPEMSFANGLNAGGVFGGTGTGSCTSSYCHGNGRANNGSIVHTAAPLTCAGCHSYTQNPTGMSGRHRLHIVDENAKCYDCHSTVVNASDAIAAPELHVDGLKENAFATSSVTYTAATKRCNGSCHGFNHQGESW